MLSVISNLLGVIFIIFLAFISKSLNNLFKPIITLEAITIGIILGMIIKNTIGVSEKIDKGVAFISKYFLELGIVLLGFRLTLSGFAVLGFKGIVIIGLHILITIILIIFLGKYLIKCDKIFTAFLAVGTAICGSSAIAALAPIMKDEKKAPVTISLVNLMAAIGVLIYTAVGHLNFLTPWQYGFWSGLTLHGVGHAIGAAFSLGIESGEIGTIVKMTRVAYLAPVIMVFSIFSTTGEEREKYRLKLPSYLYLFFLTSIINGLNLLPFDISDYLGGLSSDLILLAMIALGLTVDFSSFKNQGLKGIILVVSGFLLSSFLGLAILSAL
ncbi:YeiH family protein [Anaerobranca gottschalkii]|uniref:Conserved hypothetical integral membrane protein n=1 Tax=Anaerobranca gottschalkii DSM 13577 TaxID=1120990 RepID=A0A1I0BUL5_9FIRM|nr:putative sulfate exporter family transporter [Anaerobranca gottschalkii]SET10833.1 conserved hypothetical integral membrane protein [Anaerobranca gottschalkii DSM 13577]